jgi:hypothetical protein
MTGLSTVRMISDVGVRLAARTGSAGHPTDQLSLRDRSQPLQAAAQTNACSSDHTDCVTSFAEGGSGWSRTWGHNAANCSSLSAATHNAV